MTILMHGISLDNYISPGTKAKTGSCRMIFESFPAVYQN